MNKVNVQSVHDLLTRAPNDETTKVQTGSSGDRIYADFDHSPEVEELKNRYQHMLSKCGDLKDYRKQALLQTTFQSPSQLLGFVSILCKRRSFICGAHHFFSNHNFTFPSQITTRTEDTTVWDETASKFDNPFFAKYIQQYCIVGTYARPLVTAIVKKEHVNDFMNVYSMQTASDYKCGAQDKEQAYIRYQCKFGRAHSKNDKAVQDNDLARASPEIHENLENSAETLLVNNDNQATDVTFATSDDATNNVPAEANQSLTLQLSASKHGITDAVQLDSNQLKKKRSSTSHRNGCCAEVYATASLDGAYYFLRLIPYHSRHFVNTDTVQKLSLCEQIEDFIVNCALFPKNDVNDVIVCLRTQQCVWADEKPEWWVPTGTTDARFYPVRKTVQNIVSKCKKLTNFDSNDCASTQKLIQQWARERPDDKVIYEEVEVVDKKTNTTTTKPIICIQTPHFHHMLRTYGRDNIYLDSTHGTNIYHYSTFIIGVMDNCQHGQIGAVMILPCEEAHIIERGLTIIRDKLMAGNFTPGTVMMDKSAAEAKAVRAIWPLATILVCHFHMRQALVRWFSSKASGGLYHSRHEEVKEVLSLIQELAFTQDKETFQLLKRHLLDRPLFRLKRVNKYLLREWFDDDEFCNKNVDDDPVVDKLGVHTVIDDADEQDAQDGLVSSDAVSNEEFWARWGRLKHHDGANTNNILERINGILKQYELNNQTKRIDGLINAFLTNVSVRYETKYVESNANSRLDFFNVSHDNIKDGSQGTFVFEFSMYCVNFNVTRLNYRASSESSGKRILLGH